MALIIMCCFDTDENGRSEYTIQTLTSLGQTVDWSKHRIVVVDNNSCEKTKTVIGYLKGNSFYTIITNDENVGTARAINQGLQLRHPGEYCIKIDNDVVIHQSGWVEEMEEVIERDPTIGIVGLKRKDIDFDANHKNIDYRSELVQLPHISGQAWITVEKGPQIMGTCTMFNWRLVDKVGYMWQNGKYGFDDSEFSLRSLLAGFWNCYLPHINIEHLDRGDNPYTQEKQQQAHDVWEKYNADHAAYLSGEKSIYYDGGFTK